MSYQIHELAERTGISKDTIRYYIKIELLMPKSNPENGYKLFNEKDELRLRFICKAKYLGFTLKEIKQIILECEQGHDTSPMVREFLWRHIETNKINLQELNILQIRMETAWGKWQKMPDNQSKTEEYCAMIESVVSSDIAMGYSNQTLAQKFPVNAITRQKSRKTG